jgi:hypothetical protein
MLKKHVSAFIWAVDNINDIGLVHSLSATAIQNVKVTNDMNNSLSFLR